MERTMRARDFTTCQQTGRKTNKCFHRTISDEYKYYVSLHVSVFTVTLTPDCEYFLFFWVWGGIELDRFVLVPHSNPTPY